MRFSDPKQATGNSVDRQLNYAKKWAEERNLLLDESLTLRDEGLSAYHQRHVKQGALGAFLSAIEGNQIAPGSFLIVEGLDRLSRAEPIQAQAQLAQIINAGITVVTASDGREYNREKLKAQPMDLVYSLLVMIRAHEESDTKSKRVKAAIRRQCENWLSGTYKGLINHGHDPAWVRRDDEGFHLVPERVKALRLAINLYMEGNGSARIFEQLKSEGLELYTAKSTLYKILKNPILIGIKTLELDGEVYSLTNYYPAVLTQAEFDALTAFNSSKTRNKGKGEFPSVITGLNITYCGYCGSSIASQTLHTRNRKPDGTVQDGHRRLHCCGSNNADRCPVVTSCSAVPVEKAVFNYCADILNLTDLMASNIHVDQLNAQLIKLKVSIAETEGNLSKITDALLADDSGATPLVFIKKARELEALLAKLKSEESGLEAQLRQSSQIDLHAAAQAWHELTDKALALDYDARMKARKLVKDTFERIVIYAVGVKPNKENKKTPIDILLIPKGGTPRGLQIDRKTGEYKRAEDFLIT